MTFESADPVLNCTDSPSVNDWGGQHIPLDRMDWVDWMRFRRQDTLFDRYLKGPTLKAIGLKSQMRHFPALQARLWG